MQVIVEKDGATRVSKEVTLAQAEELATRFPVAVVVGEGLMTLDAWKAAQKPAKKAGKKKG